MKKIRYGIFESNSSSSHSLSYSENVEDRGTVEDKFSITLGVGEYGWGYEELTTWQDKADYLGVEAQYNNKDELLEEVIKSKFPNIEICYSDSGYIDHQSQGDIWNECDCFDKLYNVIFGDSIIVIDSDG